MLNELWSEWKQFWRDGKYARVRTSMICGGIALVLLTWFVRGSLSPDRPESVGPTAAKQGVSIPNGSQSAPGSNVGSASPSSDLQSVTVYVTRTGSKYHRSGCRYLRQSMIPMQLSEARGSYGPCSVCSPPR